MSDREGWPPQPFPRSISVRQLYGPAMQIETQEDADAYLALLVERLVTHFGQDEDEARRIAVNNLHAFAEDHYQDVAGRVRDLFRIPGDMVPVFDLELPPDSSSNGSSEEEPSLLPDLPQLPPMQGINTAGDEILLSYTDFYANVREGAFRALDPLPEGYVSWSDFVHKNHDHFLDELPPWGGRDYEFTVKGCRFEIIDGYEDGYEASPPEIYIEVKPPDAPFLNLGR
jgi:hypothetical protein